MRRAILWIAVPAVFAVAAHVASAQPVIVFDSHTESSFDLEPLGVSAKLVENPNAISFVSPSVMASISNIMLDLGCREQSSVADCGAGVFAAVGTISSNYTLGTVLALASVNRLVAGDPTYGSSMGINPGAQFVLPNSLYTGRVDGAGAPNALSYSVSAGASRTLEHGGRNSMTVRLESLIGNDVPGTANPSAPTACAGGPCAGGVASITVYDTESLIARPIVGSALAAYPISFAVTTHGVLTRHGSQGTSVSAVPIDTGRSDVGMAVAAGSGGATVPDNYWYYGFYGAATACTADTGQTVSACSF